MTFVCARLYHFRILCVLDLESFLSHILKNVASEKGLCEEGCLLHMGTSPKGETLTLDRELGIEAQLKERTGLAAPPHVPLSKPSLLQCWVLAQDGEYPLMRQVTSRRSK